MIAALLLASWLTTQEWSWEKSPDMDVVAYRIYWSDTTAWNCIDRVEVSAVFCDATFCQSDGVCCGDIPEPSPDVNIIVTAVDASGNESGTDRGPAPVCP